MIEIAVGDLHSQVNGDPKVVKELRNILCYENDIKTRQASEWRIPQYNYLMKPNGVFFSGLLSMVVKFLKMNNLEFEITDLRRIKEAPPFEEVSARLRGLKFADPPIELRDYQLEAVLSGLERTRGIIEAATGAGKSIILASLIMAWGKKTLVLVDSKDLAAQLREELSSVLGKPVGLIGSGVYDEQEVTVGMVQTLSSKRGAKKSKKIQAFLNTVEYLCMDECHHAQSNTWRATIRACSNASIFHGFTATPYTSKIKCEDGSTDDKNILLRAYIGPSITKIKTKFLIEEGWLAKPTIEFIENDLYWDEQPLAYVDEYTRIITKDEDRNRKACQFIAEAYNDNKQCIGFITRLDHGEIIMEMLVSEFGVDPEHIMFVTGEVDSRSRKDQIKSFKDGHLPILLGTVLNEGLNFFCDAGINISGGDSIKSTIQRLGRVLRKVKNPETGDVDTHIPAFVRYADFTDNGHPYFSKHSNNRRLIYIEEGHDVIDKESE